jgi:protein-S-isoprenylcysteine O-methyltransferase Ste14
MEAQPQLVDPSLFISLLWFTWVLIWLFAARGVKKVRVIEPASTRITYLLPKIFTATLLFSRLFRFGVLQQRFMAYNRELEWVGVVVAALGIVFTVWARFHIGRNWSARVVIKQQHELVRSGPYRFVRHPIYSGLLIAITGTALVIGEWRAVLALGFAILGFIAKARREEQIMTYEFGDEYVRYRSETGMLTPRLR